MEDYHRYGDRELIATAQTVGLQALARELAKDGVRVNALAPGVIETGLFIDIADTAVIGHADGTTELVTRPG